MRRESWEQTLDREAREEAEDCRKEREDRRAERAEELNLKDNLPLLDYLLELEDHITNSVNMLSRNIDRVGKQR